MQCNSMHLCNTIIYWIHMHYDSPSSALHYDALCVGWANDIFILKALPLKSIALSLPFIFGNQIHHLYLRANWLDWKLWQHINQDLLQIIWIFWDQLCFKDQHSVLWVLWCSGNFFISSACSSLRSNGGDNGALKMIERVHDKMTTMTMKKIACSNLCNMLCPVSAVLGHDFL